MGWWAGLKIGQGMGRGGECLSVGGEGLGV